MKFSLFAHIMSFILALRISNNEMDSDWNRNANVEQPTTFLKFKYRSAIDETAIYLSSNLNLKNFGERT